jgi:ubiquinone/menaquinone biosynthesis C-methylase UbiE
VVRKNQDYYVAREFDKAARSYDESQLTKSYQRRVQTLVINRMDIQKGMNILDIGCGTGWGVIDIALKLGGTGKVVGLDISEGMIEQAKHNLAQFSFSNVELRVGSAHSLDYDNLFDYVLSTNAYHHFEDKEEIFSKVRNALRHRGIFILQDICDDYLAMKMLDLIGKIGEKAHVGSTTSQELRNLFVSTGFSNVEIDTMKLNWFWGIMICTGVFLP